MPPEQQGEANLPVVAVNAIIIGEDGRFILTRRADTDLWCLPGGLVEFGETITEATIREVQEEIGIECSVERLVGVYSANNLRVVPPAKRCSIILAFRCRIVRGTPTISEEVRETEFFDMQSIPESLVKNHRARILHAIFGDQPILE